MEPTEEAVSAVKIEIEEVRAVSFYPILNASVDSINYFCYQQVEFEGQGQEQKRVICKYCQKVIAFYFMVIRICLIKNYCRITA